MKENIVVTGIGIIGACGINTNEFWENLCLGQSNVEEIPQSLLTKIRLGGRIRNIDEAIKELNRRLINKCDDFSKIALIAANEAIRQADLATILPERVGIFIGNNTGGWKSSYTGLKNLYIENKPVSPYMASNWFPAAVQGHMSLAFGFKGISKTLISDRTSGVLAIKHAIKNISLGKIDVAVVGGVEAPIEEWAMHFYESTQEVSCNCRYEFNTSSTGYILSEGAGFLVLESEGHANRRKAKTLAKIDEVLIKNYSRDDLKTKTHICSEMLRFVGKGKTEDVLIFPACVGKTEYDEMEIQAINNQNYQESYISLPKLLFGNTVAAGSIMDVVIAIKAMQNQVIPFASRIPIESASNKTLNITLKPKKLVEKSIIMSNGYGGTLATISIKI